jgi:hypothetical protein
MKTGKVRLCFGSKSLFKKQFFLKENQYQDHAFAVKSLSSINYVLMFFYSLYSYFISKKELLTKMKLFKQLSRLIQIFSIITSDKGHYLKQ